MFYYDLQTKRQSFPYTKELRALILQALNGLFATLSSNTPLSPIITSNNTVCQGPTLPHVFIFLPLSLPFKAFTLDLDCNPVELV